MSTMVFYARERWFEVGLMFFSIGALVALAMMALVWQAQLRVIAAIAFVQAAHCVATCAWGLRETQPARFATLRTRARTFAHRMRPAVSAERPMATPAAHR